MRLSSWTSLRRDDKEQFRLESVCHSGHSEPKDVTFGGRSVGVETLLGSSKRGRFVKAPTR